MPKSASTPDPRLRLRRYFEAQAPEARRALRTLREIIRAAAPAAEETISYGIPAFRLEDRIFLWYAGWKRHVSLYPMTDAIRRSHAPALAGYEMSKGTVRFPLAEPIPTTLIRRLVKARLAEVRAAAKPRPKPKSKPSARTR